MTKYILSLMMMFSFAVVGCSGEGAELESSEEPSGVNDQEDLQKELEGSGIDENSYGQETSN